MDLSAQTRAPDVAGNRVGHRADGEHESTAPNCSALRRFKTSASVENTCSILGARGVPCAASTYFIKSANCSAVTLVSGFDSFRVNSARSSAGVNWLRDIRTLA